MDQEIMVGGYEEIWLKEKITVIGDRGWVRGLEISLEDAGDIYCCNRFVYFLYLPFRPPLLLAF